MPINHTEIAELIGWAEANPEEWNQWEWGVMDACRSAFCIAGREVVRHGYRPRWFLRGENEMYMMYVDDDAGRSYRVRDLAARLLGLAADQANRLFAATNTIDDLKFIAKSFHEDT